MKMEDTGAHENKLTLRGFVRVAVVDRESGLVLGDTGFVPNKIQDRGFQQMICNPIMGTTATVTNVTGETNKASPPNYMGIGNRTAVAAIASNNFTHLSNSAAGSGVNGGKASASLSYVTTSDGGTIRATATWAGSTYLTGSSDATINCIAMYALTNTDAWGMCAVTYSASTWSADQDVKATYELRFSQT
jgi:hypothetical protein